ncbi:response regulator transcription factor [Aquincola sp. J276]|uniref:response regulator transcription factor n=1 Tax=Aquincola sp. J276 TaxID=2898432 RepID=UPI002150B5F5|nr:response regulator [Aquincola sp. J276]MCR5867129.1 response regulator [Aquincola sp. J276]
MTATATDGAAARTIFIVDDNADFRSSAHWWLAGAGYEVQDYADPQEALQALCSARPAGAACVLLDVRMPGMSGLDLHDRLRAQGVHWPVVYMTGHGDVPLAVQAMQRGAVSFLEKPFADQALEEALDRAFDASAVPAAALRPVAAAPAADASSSAPVADSPAQQAWQQRLARLTPRERELLGWVVEGRLNKVIADRMGISIKTVELHRKRVMEKLQAQSVTHLITMVVSGRVA